MTKNRVGAVAVEQLRTIIQRVEKLEEEKAGIGADIRDVFTEAKGSGFDVKAIRQIIKLRKLDEQERDEQENILDTYRRALGMLPELDDEDEDEVSASEPSMFAEIPSATDITDAQLYVMASAIVARDQKATTSYLQRVLKIGYNRAAHLIEMLESDGIVSAADHLGKRQVLITGEELLKQVSKEAPGNSSEAA